MCSSSGHWRTACFGASVLASLFRPGGWLLICACVKRCFYQNGSCWNQSERSVEGESSNAPSATRGRSWRALLGDNRGGGRGRVRLLFVAFLWAQRTFRKWQDFTSTWFLLTSSIQTVGLHPEAAPPSIHSPVRLQPRKCTNHHSVTAHTHWGFPVHVWGLLHDEFMLHRELHVIYAD